MKTKLPKIVDDWVKKILKSGNLKDKSQAIPVILWTLERAGIIKDNKLTPLGKARQSLWEKGRKKETVLETKNKLNVRSNKKKS